MSHAGIDLLLDNRYRLDQQIASGKFSDIWRGTDLLLARPVVVKLLRAGAADAQGLARFRTAARHAGLLAHENIARVYDYDESGSSQPPFLVMEFVDGPSLAAALADGPLEPARVMNLIAQSAAGLHAVHQAGLVHSDIRPGTLLLGPGDVLKVTGFGLSHAAQSELATAPDTLNPDTLNPDSLYPGTVYPDAGPEDPAYLAPERLAGVGGTPASDLYSLGIVAYQCLAGSVPFSGNPAEVGTAHRDFPLPALPEAVPAAVVTLVSELTDKAPGSRPGGAAEVARRAGELRDEMTPRAAGEAAGYSTLELAAQAGPRPAQDLPGGPAAGRVASRAPGGPRRPRRGRPALGRRVPFGPSVALAAAAVAVAVIALVVTGVIGPGSSGPAPASAARLGTGKTKMVEVNGAALRGQPVSLVQGKLRRLGLVVRVRWQASGQLAAGLVLSVRPAGRVPAGSVVVVIGELPPAGTGGSPANPGRHGSGAPGRSKPPGHGRSQPAGSPTPAASATATDSPTPTDSPSATASSTASPTATASLTAPASPPVTSVPSSAPPN